MHKARGFGVALTGFTVALTFLAPASARGDERSRRFTVEGRPDVHVRTDDADVRIEGGAPGEVTARVETDGRLAPDEVTITEGQTRDRIEIELRLSRRRAGEAGAGVPVRIVVRTPRQADVEVRTLDGDIAVDGVDGAIRLHTRDGAIAARGLSGQLEASSGDGDLDLSGRFTGLELRSGDGDATVTVEPGSLLAVPWSLSSGDGAIVLRLPTDLGAEIDARARDGEIDVDEALALALRVREHGARGRLGRGGLPIRIRSGDGSIRLARL